MDSGNPRDLLEERRDPLLYVQFLKKSAHVWVILRLGDRPKFGKASRNSLLLPPLLSTPS